MGRAPSGNRDVTSRSEHGFVTTIRDTGSLRAGDGGLCEQVFTAWCGELWQ